MACSYPIRIKNPNYNTSNVQKKWNYLKYFYVPCGKCLSCMISKRTWLKTACEWEYNFYGCGSFTTLTYDDIHALHLMNDEGKLELDYRDFQLFMKRLRINIERKYKIKNNWKYVAVGEYGSKTERPHFHMLIFGLDFRNNDLDILNAWENGNVMNKPILEGGINYVLKYMDKYEIRNKREYRDLDKINKPFIRYSKKLGYGFIEKNIDFIREHHGMYKGYKNRLTSLPPYWLNKLRIEPVIMSADSKRMMIEEGYYRSIKLKNGEEFKYYPKDIAEISYSEMKRWFYERNQIIEKQLIQKSRDKGIPQQDFDNIYSDGIKEEMF